MAAPITRAARTAVVTALAAVLGGVPGGYAAAAPVTADVGAGVTTPSMAPTAVSPHEDFGAPVARVHRKAPAGVVSLGDSYSSGLGIGYYDDDCDRTVEAWGMIIFADAVDPADRLLLACSGASVDDVYDQLAELESHGGTGGRLITLTVGGNDIGFASELSRCFIPLVSCTGREDLIMDRIDALVEPLTQLYLDVQDAAPHDELIVGGYPLLVPDPDVRSSCRALTPLLTSEERRMIRRLGGALNQTIEQAATEAGVRSAGTHLEMLFDGHEACANGPDDWLNGVKINGISGETDTDLEAHWSLIATVVSDSFHPNAAGHVGYAEAFTQVWSENR